MVSNRHITKVIALFMSVAIIACLFAITLPDELLVNATGGLVMEYEEKIFNTDTPLSVDIHIDENDWNDLLTNAISENYYQCDVTINNEKFYQVAIRPKGNTSLSSVAKSEDTDRYSFKLEFDKYVDGQTCYGLDKLVLNNNYADATNMKEALIYDMYKFVGADVSLYNYAKISVNGTYWGVYLALEAVEDSFMLRNYGVENGKLYKPDGMDIGGGMGRGGNKDFGNMPEGFDPSQIPDNVPERSEMPNFGGSGGKVGFGMGGSGANLNYIDDNLDSYSSIWEGALSDISDSDRNRVVTALKNISQGTNLEQYMDVDNLIKYMAVHVFSVNDDSLSGNMAHNYYLYESNGMLNLLPWDYNLSFGGMVGGMGGENNATNIVNDPIDNAFSSTNFFDTLMDNDTHHKSYYKYLRKLVDEYINGGRFHSFYSHTRQQLDNLIKTDPTAFYTYDEYLTAIETLYEVVMLRGESIDKQLDGTIPATSQNRETTENLVDASHIDLKVIGRMNMGGDNNRGEMGNNNRFFLGNTPTNSQVVNGESTEKASETAQTENRQNRFPNGNNNTSLLSTIIPYFLSFVLLVGAIIFALCYKRKPRKR